MIFTVYQVLLRSLKRTYRYVTNAARRRRDKGVEDFIREPGKKCSFRGLSRRRGYNIKRDLTRDIVLGCKVG
jgi:hypothetical protein